MPSAIFTFLKGIKIIQTRGLGTFVFLTVGSFIQNELLGTNPIYISSFIQSKIFIVYFVQSTWDIAMNTIYITPQTLWNLQSRRSALVDGNI